MRTGTAASEACRLGYQTWSRMIEPGRTRSRTPATICVAVASTSESGSRSQVTVVRPVRERNQGRAKSL
jgi:hypothetical protein